MGEYVVLYNCDNSDYQKLPKGANDVMAKINYINIESIHPLAYSVLYEQASEERRKKADKYIKQEDAIMCILSEAMLRYALHDVRRQSGVLI